MTKYIRLKDKIVKVDAEDSECYYFNKLKKFVYKDEGYKTADTIEELCDEFVFVSKTGKNIIFREDMFFSTPQEARGKMDCYGAIWTNKGLVYVAEMNKDGEFELCKD